MLSSKTNFSIHTIKQFDSLVNVQGCSVHYSTEFVLSYFPVRSRLRKHSWYVLAAFHVPTSGIWFLLLHISILPCIVLVVTDLCFICCSIGTMLHEDELRYTPEASHCNATVLGCFGGTKFRSWNLLNNYQCEINYLFSVVVTLEKQAFRELLLLAKFFFETLKLVYKAITIHKKIANYRHLALIILCCYHHAYDFEAWPCDTWSLSLQVNTCSCFRTSFSYLSLP